VNRTLLILAHPNLQESRVNRALLQGVQDLPQITVADLYGQSPETPFSLDVQREQARLLDHENLVFQFPFYWYSSPALLKEWQDRVLTHGFAYGTGGDKLHGKRLLVATSSGGPGSSYGRKGYNRFTMDELLRPFEATAHLTGMSYLKPSLFQCDQGIFRLEDSELETWVSRYRARLEQLCQSPGDLESQDTTT